MPAVSLAKAELRGDHLAVDVEGGDPHVTGAAGDHLGPCRLRQGDLPPIGCRPVPVPGLVEAYQRAVVAHDLCDIVGVRPAASFHACQGRSGQIEGREP